MPFKIKRLSDTVWVHVHLSSLIASAKLTYKTRLDYSTIKEIGERETFYGAFQAGEYDPDRANGLLARFMPLRSGPSDVAQQEGLAQAIMYNRLWEEPKGVKMTLKQESS